MDIRKKWFAENAPLNAIAASVDSVFDVANAEIVVTAKIKGEIGNEIVLNLIDLKEENVPLSIDVDKKTINVILATDSQGAIKTKASELKTAIADNELASELIKIDFATGNSGAGVVDGAELVLENGVNGTVCQDTEVIVKHDNQLYINIAPNSIHDANWRKLNLVEY